MSINLTRKLTRRSLFALGALVLLAACMEPLADESVTRNLVVRDIYINTDNIEGIEGREIVVSPEKIRADLTMALISELGYRRSDTGNADVVISITKVHLLSPGGSLMIGGNSFIKGVIKVTEVGTGKVLVPATKVTGLSEQKRLGGIIGAMSSPSAANDYRATIIGFARNVKNSLTAGS